MTVFESNSCRPETLPLFAACFIVGLQIGATFQDIGSWPFFFLMLFSLLLLSISPNIGLLEWLLLIFSAIFLGAFVYSQRSRLAGPFPQLKEFHENQVEIEGTFVGELKFKKRGGLRFTIENPKMLLASQSFIFPGNIKLDVKSLDSIPEPGQRYQAVGILKVYSNRKFPEVHCENFSLASETLWLSPTFGKIRQWVKDGVINLLPSNHRGLVIGMLLGDTSFLDRHSKEVLKKTGVSHLLAVSGQHIMVLAVVFLAILRWIGIPPISRCLITILFLLGYGFITTGQPSVWRAICMYICSVISLSIEANPGPIRPIALAALLLLIYRPDWIHHIGFQLSFMAVLGIVLLRVPFEYLFVSLKLPTILARYFAVCFAANVAILPLCGMHFGFVPLISFIVNPLIVWSFGIILPLSFLVCILGNIWFNGGMALAAALSLLLDGFQRIIEVCSLVPGTELFWPQNSTWLPIIIYSCLLWFVVKFNTSTLPSIGITNQQTFVKQPGSAPITSKLSTAKQELPCNAHIQPLSNQELVDKIDHELKIMRPRSLKSRGNIELHSFPINKLSVEGQNLFYRLDDLTREVLMKEPERLLQAQIFSLALIGSELIEKVLPHLSPAVSPSDLNLKIRTKNRHLALALFSDAFLNSPLLMRASETEITTIIYRAKRIHSEGTMLIAKYIQKRDFSGIPDHLSHRQTVLTWCRDLINFHEMLRNK